MMNTSTALTSTALRHQSLKEPNKLLNISSNRFCNRKLATELPILARCCQYDAEDRREECVMEKSYILTPEERARITEIQDALIDRYVEQKEALENNEKARATEIGFEIKELKREIEEVKEWAGV
jgi:hypothetical protein